MKIVIYDEAGRAVPEHEDPLAYADARAKAMLLEQSRYTAAILAGVALLMGVVAVGLMVLGG
jgi:hypothetical protein